MSLQCVKIPSIANPFIRRSLKTQAIRRIATPQRGKRFLLPPSADSPYPMIRKSGRVRNVPEVVFNVADCRPLSRES